MSDHGTSPIVYLAAVLICAWPVLQVVTLFVLRGGWRTAAFIPLLPGVLAYAALLASWSKPRSMDNLGGVWALLFGPIGAVYLLVVLIGGLIAARRADAPPADATE